MRCSARRDFFREKARRLSSSGPIGGLTGVPQCGSMTGNEADETPDPLRELDRELREALGGEFRRTAEEDEFAARKAALRKRDMAHVAYELLSRGDLVRVTVGDASISGVVSHARGTLATVTPSVGTPLHVNLAGPILIEIAERSTTRGSRPDRFGPETFIARLRELELNATPVEVLLGSTPRRPTGRIEAVARDHLMLAGETTQFVPLGTIGAVRSL